MQQVIKANIVGFGGGVRSRVSCTNTVTFTSSIRVKEANFFTKNLLKFPVQTNLPYIYILQTIICVYTINNLLSSLYAIYKVNTP